MNLIDPPASVEPINGNTILPKIKKIPAKARIPNVTFLILKNTI